MSNAPDPAAPTAGTSRASTLRFLRHFAEMVAAMAVGMMLLGPLWTLVWPHLHAAADLHVMTMATDMAIGMALWMWFRRHSWISIGQMTAAMYAPFVVLLGPYWGDLISADTLSLAGHVLMLPCMLGAMLLRRDEYSQPHQPAA